ncbi:hypothetical protein R1sor_000992 [Riccia sorocarpa]|uniref:Uncharacterized protein n=1 Tax=Riccia sorocarpa TaxID=122646 RepID=A0ABD3GXV3_9MARC
MQLTDHTPKKPNNQPDPRSPWELVRVADPHASHTDSKGSFRNLRSPTQAVGSEHEGRTSPISSSISEPAEAMNGSEGLQIRGVSEGENYDVNFAELEATLGYTFHLRSLLAQAVTHPSCLSASGCYPRLEFVGDAVLNHLIADYFFVKYQDLDTGRLTELRQATVNNENFARIALKYRFHHHLRHESASLLSKINAFSENIKTELDKPGINSFGLGDIRAPKVLGDILESIAGAVYVDSGLNGETVWQVFEPLLQPLLTPDMLPRHPISELQERCQQSVDELRYHSYRRDPLTFVVEVFVNEELIATATNPKKKVAQKLAARNALIVLNRRDESAEATAEDGSISEFINHVNRKAQANMPIALDQLQIRASLSEKRNYKQILYELCLSNKWSSEFRCVSEVRIAHVRKFTFLVRVFRDQEWKDYVGEPMPSIGRAKDSAAARYLQFHLQTLRC